MRTDEKTVAEFGMLLCYIFEHATNGHSGLAVDVKEDLREAVERVFKKEFSTFRKELRDVVNEEIDDIRATGERLSLIYRKTLEANYRRICKEMDQALDDYFKDKREQEISARIEQLEKIEHDPEKRQEYEQGMKQIVAEAKELFDPIRRANRKKRIKDQMELALKNAFVYSNMPGYENMPLRPGELTPAARIERFDQWITAHYF